VKKIEENRYEYFSQWYHCVIRELVTMVDFKEDFRRLGKMLLPPITGKQAHDSVRLLLKLGFLKKENGAYSRTSPLLSTGPSVNAHKIVLFQIQMLKRAIEAFDLSPPTDRMNSSTTLRVSRKYIKKYYDRIREMRAALMEMDREEQCPEEVYQLNVSFAPMSNLSNKRVSAHGA
jgi:uncharacterized protein (TIGR02147 family)